MRSTTLPMPNLSYISPKATVQESPIHGRGLFAIAPIAQGEIVCVKGGYILTREVLSTMPEWYGGADIPVADNLYIGPLRQEEREGSMIFRTTRASRTSVCKGKSSSWPCGILLREKS